MRHPCTICGTTDVPTFEAGGEWWCAGCAHFQTEMSAGLYDAPALPSDAPVQVQQEPGSQRRFITIREASLRLFGRYTASTHRAVVKLCDNGELAHQRFGSRGDRLILSSDIDRMFADAEANRTVSHRNDGRHPS